MLKGMGRAINKTVTIAEIVKRRVAGLHQNTEISSLEMTDTWEPREEGLRTVVTTRHVSVIEVTLCRDVGRMATTSPGYQAPIPEDQVRPVLTTFAKKKKKQQQRTSFEERPRGEGETGGEGGRGGEGEGDAGKKQKRRSRRGRGGRGKHGGLEEGGGGVERGAETTAVRDERADGGGQRGGEADKKPGGTRRGSRGGGGRRDTAVAPAAD